jgi:hypothetical protein
MYQSYFYIILKDTYKNNQRINHNTIYKVVSFDDSTGMLEDYKTIIHLRYFYCFTHYSDAVIFLRKNKILKINSNLTRNNWFCENFVVHLYHKIFNR